MHLMFGCLAHFSDTNRTMTFCLEFNIQHRLVIIIILLLCMLTLCVIQSFWSQLVAVTKLLQVYIIEDHYDESSYRQTDRTEQTQTKQTNTKMKLSKLEFLINPLCPSLPSSSFFCLFRIHNSTDRRNYFCENACFVHKFIRDSVSDIDSLWIDVQNAVMNLLLVAVYLSTLTALSYDEYL